MTNDPTKPGGKGAETALNLIGTLANIAGKVIFGPSGINVDIGTPFLAGAQMLGQRREQQNLMKLLSSTPQTAQVMQVGQALHDAGGLVNNSDLIDHPEVAQAVNMQSPAPSPGNGAVPNANLMSPGITGQKIDLSSPEFWAKASQLRPDLVEKALPSAMAQKTGPLDTIMAQLGLTEKMQRIQSYESPQERRAAQQADREALMAASNNMITGRQEQHDFRAQQIKKETWTPKETEGLTNLDNAVNTGMMLYQKAQAGLQPSTIQALLGQTKIGMAALQRLDPAAADQLNTMREIRKNVMAQVKQQSGQQYGEKELRWLQAALPSEFDTPEMFRRSMANEILKNKWMQLNTVANKVVKAQNLNPATDMGITGEQLAAFDVLKKRLQATGTAGASPDVLFADPTNAALLKATGMDLLLGTK